MDFSSLVSYNNSEGGRINSIVFLKLFFFFKISTSIHQCFRPAPPFPSRRDTGIGVVATREANGNMKRVLEKQARQQSAKKRK